MKSLVFVHPSSLGDERVELQESIRIGKTSVCPGILNANPDTFDLSLPENFSKVVVDVKAFSCNYRDRVLATLYSRQESTKEYAHFGSDFVGKVIQVGKHVSGLHVGDRVINDNHYPVSRAQGLRPGVPTNEASARRLILHEFKLMKIPDSLPNVTAAAFSVCAQTAYAIIRKLQLRPGERGLITAATSGTSLATLGALHASDNEVYAVSTGLSPDRDLRDFGAAGTVRLRRPVQQSLSEHELLKRISRRKGGISFVVDPFADLYLEDAIDLLADGGRYVTCGIFNQAEGAFYPSSARKKHFSTRTLEQIIIKNVTIIGNCLGTTDDLHNAIHEHSARRFNPVIDSTFEGSPVPFLRRSFVSQDRFGKVVYEYSG